MCVGKLCVSELCVSELRRKAGGRTGGSAQPKTRIPHNVVGSKCILK